MGQDGASPRTGDLVRARQDRRDGEWVEGILHLRLVPALDSVQVVVHVGERLIDVDASSVVVLRPAAMSVQEVYASEPLCSEPGWRPVVDLDQAEREGLLDPPVERVGGSWADLVRELRLRVDPLLEAGWRIVDEARDESWEYGDSVCFDLERDTQHINVEYYEHGAVDVYEIIEGEEYDPDDPESEPAPPVLTIDVSEPETCLAAFRAHGWVP